MILKTKWLRKRSHKVTWEKQKNKKGKKKGKKIINLQIHIIVSFSTYLILLERF